MNYMKALLLLALTSAVIVGCNDGATPASPPANTPDASHANTLYKNKIYLPDGTAITFTGYLINYSLTQNEKGSFEAYTFNFDSSLMNLEGSTYASLAKAGYLRKIHKEEPSLFLVSYIKKGFPPVNVNYKDLSEKSKGMINTQARMAWKLNK
jgi:hypothetical protein